MALDIVDQLVRSAAVDIIVEHFLLVLGFDSSPAFSYRAIESTLTVRIDKVIIINQVYDWLLDRLDQVQ